MSFINYNDLGRVDSATFGNLASQSIKFDQFALNMTFSMGRNNSRFYDLNRQPTNMSQVSVGGFKIKKDTAINQNGDIIVSQYFDLPKHEDFEELDNVMFNNTNSINVSKQLANNLQGSFLDDNKNQNNLNNPNDLNNLPIEMTCSFEMDNNSKQNFKNQLMSKSINRRMYDDILLDQSSSVRQQMNNLVSVNLTQFQKENMMKHSNANYKQILPISLIDRRIETYSEPDLDIKHYDFFDLSDDHKKHQKDSHNHNNNSNFSSNVKMEVNDKNNSSSNLSSDYICTNNNNNITNNMNNNNSVPQNMKESQNQGLTIEPFLYKDNTFQDYQYPHSDDEYPAKKSPPQVKPAVTAQQQKKAQKGSQYRQSRHKNVFKNFGGTLVRFIIYNQYFQDRVIQELNKDAQKQKGFQDWLQSEIKLERKKDFQIAWTTFKSDPENIREYKALLRELSRDFFENFSFIYLINSKKISDMEIHLRSIHTYLAAINNPDSLERFKPV
ncbi:hypothetical protein ABPG72_008279 [Tetrahymena utriculariae]